MSVPIFEKGDTLKLKELKKIINKTSSDDLEPYLNTHFEFLGVHLFKTNIKHITSKELLTLQKKVRLKCSFNDILIASGGQNGEGEILRIIVLKKGKLYSTDLTLDSNIIDDIVPELEEIAQIISPEIKKWMK